MEGTGVPVVVVDHETEFLSSKTKTGDEWEIYKENVWPLKRGRKVEALNCALKPRQDCRLWKELLEKRRELIKAIDDYNGDDPLRPWIECIKWVQEAFPAGGETSGLVVLYELCARAFWNSDRYKNDLRYLKVWLEYGKHCNDAEVIYGFLDDNDIGKKHALLYISHARHMESKDKVKAANEIFNRGISSAQPIKKLEDAFRKFLARSLRRPPVDDEEADSSMPNRSFGTDVTMGGNAGRSLWNYNHVSDKQMEKRVPLGIYKDKNTDISSRHQLDDASKRLGPWKNLGARVERNKENQPMHSKWTSYKKLSVVAAGGEAVTRSTLIEVYIDEDCEQTGGDLRKSSKAELGRDEMDIQMKEELLMSPAQFSYQAPAKIMLSVKLVFPVLSIGSAFPLRLDPSSRAVPRAF